MSAAEELKALKANLATLALELEEARIIGGVHDTPGRENDLRAIDLARFAVDAHNKKNARLANAFVSCTGLKFRVPIAACMNSQLEFEKLVKVREQRVAGKLYYFTIKAKDGEAKKLYEAKVWEKPWENFKELREFKPVEESSA